MRTTEATLDLTLASATPSVARPAGLMRVVTAVWRMLVNRHAIGTLQDLTDDQLRDIGINRNDVKIALNSSVFEAPDRYLSDIARQRSSSYYRTLRDD